MSPDRIDFSSLDPSRDAGRWEALVQGVSVRALAGRQSPVLLQLTAWARPALAAAALAALLCWLPSLAPPAPSAESAELPTGDARARALSEWEAGHASAGGQAALASLEDSLEQ